MYRDVKRSRVNEALEFIDKKFEFVDEIEKLQMIITQAQKEMKKAVDDKEITFALKAKAEQALLDATNELQAKKLLRSVILTCIRF